MVQVRITEGDHKVQDEERERLADKCFCENGESLEYLGPSSKKSSGASLQSWQLQECRTFLCRNQLDLSLSDKGDSSVRDNHHGDRRVESGLGGCDGMGAI